MSKSIPKPFILAILDGWGWNSKTIDNPIAQAEIPIFNMINRDYPSALVQASGLAVGMGWDESGNSEVGHFTIGAGRIIEQYNSKIKKSIANGQFFENPVLVGAFKHARNNNSCVHIAGLLTSGTVHASIDQLVAILELAARLNFDKIFLHLFLDGVDSGPFEGENLLGKVMETIERLKHGKIATLIGRDFAMDKDNNWQKTKKAYDLIVNAMGERTENLVKKVQELYGTGLNDPKILPLVNNSSNYTGINDGDTLIFFNFREDGIRQIAKPFAYDGFSEFVTKKLNNLYSVSMTKYFSDGNLNAAFEPSKTVNTISEVLSAGGKKQIHIAETIKYAHVTYFFNGLTDNKFSGEEDVLVESFEVAENNPKMRSEEIANRVVDEISKGYYDFILINFANPDMLAHSGNFEAAIRGIGWVDKAMGEIYNATIAKDAVMIITADHGNAESMLYRGSGEISTRHDPSPVPIYLIGKNYKRQNPGKLNTEIVGILADIAPTVLEIMQIPKPPEMTGESLIRELK